MKIYFLEPAVEEGSYCWLLDVGGRFVGVHSQAGWCMRTDNGIIALDEEKKFVLLGPVLDLPAIEFSAFLKRATDALPAWAHLIKAFPKEYLLKHIFHTSYSGYWPERALAWLEADQEQWPNFQNELRDFSLKKGMPQAARQHAQRIMRAMEKQNLG